MQRSLIRSLAIALGLHAAVFLTAACSTSDMPPAAASDAQGGAGGDGGVLEPGTGGTGGRGGDAGIGGDVGSGGTSGTSGKPGKTFPQLPLPDELAWLTDPEIWTPIPQQDDWDSYCTLWQADPDRMQFPPLVWEPCGEGCAKADIHQGHGTVAAKAAISMAYQDGVPTPFLHVNNAGMPASTYKIQISRFINLQSGHTVAAVEQVARLRDGFVTCGAGVMRDSALTVVSFRNRDPFPQHKVRGTWNIDRREWIWQLPWATPDDTGFDTGYCSIVGMVPGGRTFYLCGNLIRAAITPGSSELTMLDRPGDAGFYVGGFGAALGDWFVWPENDKGAPGSRIRAWRPDGEGVRTLRSDVPVDTCAVGLSDTHVAGFSTRGACDSFQREGRFWIADRADDGTLDQIRLGPVFWPEPVTEADVVTTWGNHIATVWAEKVRENPADRRRLLLARTTDWAMRDIRGSDGREVWAAGLTDDHLYVVYTLFGAKVGQFSAVHRYDLDKFELIGQPIVPVEGLQQ